MIEEIRRRDPRLIVGVTSGSACDAIDTALVELSGEGESLSWKLRAHAQFPWSPDARERIGLASHVATSDVAAICRLNAYVGEHFARAVEGLAEQAGVPLDEIALVGCGGQPLQHLPEPASFGGLTVVATQEAGDPAVLAERTGLAVVSGFRARDLASGGQGGPLWALVDWLLFHDPNEGRIALHVGGIASVTAIPPGVPVEKVTAFDTGPGTGLVDLLVRRLTGGEQPFDHDGVWAARGRADENLLRECLENPYFETAPPKSTGWEEFGPDLLEWFVLRGHAVAFEDLVATATEFAARSIVRGIEEHVLPEGEFARVLVSGGGVRNRTLLARLRALLGELGVESTERWGLPPEAKGALAFAVLANEFVFGRPSRLPGATGALRPAILGSFTPGRVR